MKTTPQPSPEMLASARQIGEAMIAMRKRTGTVQDYQAAMAASREQHGEDLHNIVKGLALAGATGGRA